jgi:hypothetical protein
VIGGNEGEGESDGSNFRISGVRGTVFKSFSDSGELLDVLVLVVLEDVVPSDDPLALSSFAGRVWAGELSAVVVLLSDDELTNNCISRGSGGEGVDTPSMGCCWRSISGTDTICTTTVGLGPTSRVNSSVLRTTALSVEDTP